MSLPKLIFTFSFLFSSQVFSETIFFDLGGPCLKQDSTPVAHQGLTFQKIKEAKKKQQWDIVIDEARLDVREDCSVPHRWEELFTVVVEAKRYKDAVSILNEMKKRGLFLPHVVLSRTDASFLKSTEFSTSELGIKFHKEQNLFDKLIAEAKIKIGSMSDSEKPPKLYFSEGACPFECCQFGKWKTRTPVQLFDDIRSSHLVIEIPNGIEVKAQTGKVLKEPEPYVVLESVGSMKQGDVLFILDYLGEGGINYWYKGKVSPDVNTELSTSSMYEEDQSNIQDSRWLKKIYPEKSFADEWWVKIRVANGKVGWVKAEAQFDGTDACGH